MKKILVLTAFASVLLTSCDNNDDDAVSADYLYGTWVETDPVPGNHTLNFNDSIAVLYRSSGEIDTLSYNYQEYIEQIDGKTMKLRGFYPEPHYAGQPPTFTTFKKQ